MFTGLVDDVGTVAGATDTAAGREIEIVCAYTGLEIGESISCNGACLTVIEHKPGSFAVAAVTTTLERTTIGSWTPGRRVNLERAMRSDGRFGGHIVAGHVDGVGRVARSVRQGNATLIDIEVPEEVYQLLVPHGSVAVDGVSLTVNEIPGSRLLQISLIEHTLRHTTLGALASGDLVHLESDIVGKYVRRLLSGYFPGA